LVELADGDLTELVDSYEPVSRRTRFPFRSPKLEHPISRSDLALYFKSECLSLKLGVILKWGDHERQLQEQLRVERQV